jgi:hypothetical protein
VILRLKNELPIFKKMNTVLVARYKRQGIIPSLGEHRKNFEQTYNVRVVVENNIWAALEFPSEQDAIVSIMKWG